MAYYKIQLAFLLVSISFSLNSQTSDSTAIISTDTPVVIPVETPAVTTELAPAATTVTDAVTPVEETSSITTEPVVTEAPIGSLVDTTIVVAEPTPDKKTSAAPNAKAIAIAKKKGNLYYNTQSYSEAIPYYEKIMRSDTTDKIILSNLGNAYRLTNNTEGQLLCYGALVRQGVAEPIQELYYGQALVEAGKSEEAKPYFEKYAADSRGLNLASSYAKMKTYSRNADAYSVTPVSYNSPQNDMCAVMFHDAVVFASTRTKTSWITKQQGWTQGGYMNLYSTEKDENGADMTPTVFMGDLDSKYNDGPICFTRDFNLVYFTRNNASKAEMAKDKTYKLKILEASMDENGFNMVKALPFNNNDYNYAHPSISADGFVLYFSSDMEGGKGGMDIYMSKKDSSGSWGAPINLGDKINTAGNEVFPFVSSNGVLYFSSNGLDGLGGLDIYETQLSLDMPTRVYNMGEPVNSKNDDFSIFLMEDNKYGFISSNRKAGGMDDDIYQLQIMREIKRGKEVKIITKDKLSGEFIANAKVVINGDTVLTDDKGEYNTIAEEDTDYKLAALKDDYFKVEDEMSSKSSLDESFTKELLLEKDPKLFLRAVITDGKTQALLEGVTLKVTDIATNTEIDNYTTTAEGDYFKFLLSNRIGDKLTYLIRIEKPGYLQRTVIFTHTIEKSGEINMNESLNLSLGKVEVGMDLAKMIDMKPIYFDLAKSTIRKDAAIELDKIVQVMNEYPNMFIELGSHTDCRSSAASNMKLSTDRAMASVTYIVNKGIDKSRIVGKGYGESKLLNNCSCEGKTESTCSEEEHAVNRRTEFIITKLD
ncbi:OmpA family protein [Aurantibacillus circumpalustris]|uniref:OmpA family protein n=1 Tax=Aurantibacillus circumpalustris TaxID=3036359 RepID=UPI00295BE4DA|nr:OmpA family protein [Aurantibacillus circumpalustris]